jgi:predicted dehydrogenase
MDKTKVGILGVGHLGRLHTSLYKEINSVEITGIYDVNSEKAQKVGDELGVLVFKEVDELLNQVDAVNIVTPTPDHFSSAQKALDNDCHLFVEKPITDSVEQAEKIIQLAKEKNKILQVGHIERFNPALLALEDVKLNPIFIESHRLASFNPRGSDVAVILDLMIHDLDLILSLVKSKPAKIDASGVGVISNHIDIANARIQFENGCVANVTASRISAKKMRKMRIFQQDAYISLDFTDGFSEIYYIPAEDQVAFKDGTLAFSLGEINTGEKKKEIKYNKLQRKDINPLKFELETFVDAIIANIGPVVSGEDGLNALRLAKEVMKKIDDHTQYVEARNKS